MKRIRPAAFLLFRYLVLLALFALLGPRSHGQVTPEPEWFACTIDTECTAERDACGQEEIVNRRFVESYRLWKGEVYGMLECTEAGDRAPASAAVKPPSGARKPASNARKPQKVICSKGRCSIAVTKTR